MIKNADIRTNRAAAYQLGSGFLWWTSARLCLDGMFCYGANA
jgi:hypothetical protein